MNSDELKFDHVVGMMQAYELQMKRKDQMPVKAFGLKAVVDQPSMTEDQVGLIVRKIFKKMDRGPRKEFTSQAKDLSSRNRYDSDRDKKRGDKQCAECEGFGHFKAECPTIKRRTTLKCYECKGYGHTRNDCLGTSDYKQKSYATWSESDTDEEEGGEEILNNFVAYIGIIEEEEEEEISMIIEYLFQKKKENQNLISEKEILTAKVENLEKQLSEEKQKSVGLENQLKEQMKNIKIAEVQRIWIKFCLWGEHQV
ncbi:unnamed protein product [Arabidopsis halleri]